MSKTPRGTDPWDMTPEELPVSHPLHPDNPIVARVQERRELVKPLSLSYPFSEAELFGATWILGDQWRALEQWLEYLVANDLELGVLDQVAR